MELVAKAGGVAAVMASVALTQAFGLGVALATLAVTAVLIGIVGTALAFVDARRGPTRHH